MERPVSCILLRSGSDGACGAALCDHPPSTREPNAISRYLCRQFQVAPRGRTEAAAGVGPGAEAPSGPTSLSRAGGSAAHPRVGVPAVQGLPGRPLPLSALRKADGVAVRGRPASCVVAHPPRTRGTSRSAPHGTLTRRPGALDSARPGRTCASVTGQASEKLVPRAWKRASENHAVPPQAWFHGGGDDHRRRCW